MSILRKQTKSRYTHIANDILEDARLSFRARGLAAYLLSKPDDWVIRVEALAREAREGEKAILTAMRELAAYGYLRRDRAHDALGHIYTVTHLADYPAFVDDGTPQERKFGYTDPPKTGGSVRASTDPPETEGSVNRGSENRGVGFGGVILNTDLPIPDLPTTVTDADANASAHPPAQAGAAPAGSSSAPLVDAFREFHDRLKHDGANRAEILRCAFRRCYGDGDLPDHGRLGAFARRIGSWGQALDLLWSNTARPPNGDILAYLEAQHDARQRDRRAAKPAPRDRAAYVAGVPDPAEFIPTQVGTAGHAPPAPDARTDGDPWAIALQELRAVHGPDDLAPFAGSRLELSPAGSPPGAGVDGVPLYRVLLARPDPDGYLTVRYGALIRRTLGSILHRPVLVELVEDSTHDPAT